MFENFRLYQKKLENVSRDAFYKLNDKISYKTIYDNAKCINDFDKFINWLSSYLGSIDINRFDDIDAENAGICLGYANDIWYLCNCKRFMIDIDDFDFSDFVNEEKPFMSSYNINDIFDAICNSEIQVVSNKYEWPILISIRTGNETINYGNFKRRFIYVRILTINSDDSITDVANYAIIEGINNKIFVRKNDSNRAAFSDAPLTEIKFPAIRHLVGFSEQSTYFQIHKSRLIRDGLNLKVMRPFDIMNIIAAAFYKYSNKELVLKEKANRSSATIITTATTVDDVYKEVYIPKKIYKYLQKSEPKGGHHASPVEHERRKHQRVYRNPDGSVKKVVEVRATTVNKGSEKKAVYHV